jgi:hypothetical protein
MRHWRQCPHTMWPSAVTKSPGLSNPAEAASRPSLATSPANSWPMTTGGLSLALAQASHSQIWRSVPQTPAWWTLMTKSVQRFPYSGPTSRSSIPGPGAGLRGRALLEGSGVRVRRQGRSGVRGGCTEEKVTHHLSPDTDTKHLTPHRIDRVIPPSTDSTVPVM